MGDVDLYQYKDFQTVDFREWTSIDSANVELQERSKIFWCSTR